MRAICIFMIFSATCFCGSKANIQPMSVMNECFSAANFDLVYRHIRENIDNDDLSYYTYGKYQLHPDGSAEIMVKENGYTLAIISRDKGIYSLAKVLSDNINLVGLANQIFCEVLEKRVDGR
ncbi:hypothetical protein LVD17_22345 [Fulvivirga ulvae]|uniref:hypothetical protein n=1 Tax=Fulvivirga ulvae TaxID=2904245 RepID=UPI001F462DEF|nr:hypothetical protein [Fulvivirga ulvae]UII31036.1 hypothetical protein LVD17_22345 [Fulvivirga ulvae]